MHTHVLLSISTNLFHERAISAVIVLPIERRAKFHLTNRENIVPNLRIHHLLQSRIVSCFLINYKSTSYVGII